MPYPEAYSHPELTLWLFWVCKYHSSGNKVCFDDSSLKATSLPHRPHVIFIPKGAYAMLCVFLVQTLNSMFALSPAEVPRQ
jgi:hypothetical protein